jgi:hypothetical protein
MKVMAPVRVVLLVVLLPGIAAAQARGSSQSRPSTAPSVPPPIVFPFPPLMAPPAGGLTPGTPFVPTDLTQPPRDLYRVDGHSNPYQPRPLPPPRGTFGGYPVGDTYVPAPSEIPTSSWRTGSGLLQLSVTPASGQVFVDSYYVGTVEDIERQRGLTLPVGPHRLDIKAPNYQTLTFDVRIDPNDTVTYRGSLERAQPPVQNRPPATAAATRMYVIPNCYLGNIPPRPDRLPAGCNISQVRIVGDK